MGSRWGGRGKEGETANQSSPDPPHSGATAPTGRHRMVNLLPHECTMPLSCTRAELCPSRSLGVEEGEEKGKGQMDVVQWTATQTPPVADREHRVVSEGADRQR